LHAFFRSFAVGFLIGLGTLLFFAAAAAVLWVIF